MGEQVTVHMDVDLVPALATLLQERTKHTMRLRAARFEDGAHVYIEVADPVAPPLSVGEPLGPWVVPPAPPYTFAWPKAESHG